MKLATLRGDAGKFKVIDPREGKGVLVFKTLDEAAAAQDAANAEIMAESEAAIKAAMPKISRIEILSRDGAPVHGVPTTQADDSVVFTSKDGSKKTEIGLCDVAGYVIVSRSGNGKVRAEWGNPPDFGRYVPISAAGIAALQGVLTPKASE